MRKDKNDRMNTSVPCLIEQVRKALESFTTHPDFSQPWPQGVPSLQYLHYKIECLESAYQAVQAMSKPDTPAVAAVNRARRELKTGLSMLGCFVEMTVKSMSDVRNRIRSDKRRKTRRLGAK